MTQNAFTDLESNSSIISIILTSLTARTAVHWLHKLGYDWNDIKNGLYKNGHNRDNVIEYQQSMFLPMLAKLPPTFNEWILNDDGSFTLITPEFNGQLRVVVTHDKCTFNANNCCHQQWTKSGGMSLQSKS